MKDKDYIQLIDDNGYLHQVGPANHKSFAAALYTMGLLESHKWLDWLIDYYKKKGVKYNPRKTKLDEIEVFYHDGLNGLTPRSGSPIASRLEIIEISDPLINRVKMFDDLHKQLKKRLEADGYEFSKAKLRKCVQKKVRESSDEEKSSWLDLIK